MGTVFISAAAYRLIQSGITLFYANQKQYPLPLVEQLQNLAYGDEVYTRLDFELEAQDYDKALLAVAHAVMWTRISSILGSVVSKYVLMDMGRY